MFHDGLIQSHVPGLKKLRIDNYNEDRELDEEEETPEILGIDSLTISISTVMSPLWLAHFLFEHWTV